MIRIIGGKHRGRMLATPEGEATRPTSNRARESLFNILMHANWRDDEDGGTSPLIEARVLDAYAGSGALGLEALSRGAAHATFLDNDAAAVKAIGENLRKLGETGAAKVVRADATRPPPSREPCDLAFLDPPYRSGQAPAAIGRPRRGRLDDAGLHRHRRARAQRGPVAAGRLRNHRRAPLRRGQDRDPETDGMKLPS
jgi:16S rRNA (guanine966-N2)-methyltransferase